MRSGTLCPFYRIRMPGEQYNTHIYQTVVLCSDLCPPLYLNMYIEYIYTKKHCAWQMCTIFTESVWFARCIQYTMQKVFAKITWLFWTCVFLLSIHLTCWLDLEQYRRTPQKDKAVRQERSSHIAAKYLNRKYFFGSDSPDTTEQQNDVRQSITWFKNKTNSMLRFIGKPILSILE